MILDKTAASLYTTLTGGTALTALLASTTSVYHMQAPDNAALPYLVFNQQGGGPENLDPHGIESNLWYIRVYSSTSAKNSSEIFEQADSLLHKINPSIVGYRTLWSAREENIQMVENLPNNKKIWSAGGLFRIRTSNYNTWYLDNINGDDTNTGRSASEPLATVAQVSKSFASGDIISLVSSTPTKSMTLKYIDASTMYVFSPLDGYIYWARWKLALLASGFWTRNGTRVFRAMDATDRTDGGVTESGSWSTAQSVATALGGNYRSCKNLDAYAEWTITGAERVYIAYEKRSNGGYMKVTVDGAAANGSDLTTVGSDKCLDCYAATTIVNQWGCVATGLTPADTYTIRIAPQGTTSGGSDTYMYWEGYGFPCTAFTQANDTVTNDNTEIVYLEDTDPGYAYTYTPSGAASAELTGSAHQNEAINTVTWTDQDGVTISVNGGSPTNDSEQIVLTQTGYARHSETGATNNASITNVLTFSQNGCQQDVAHTWAVAATMGACYLGMMPGRSICDRGYVADGLHVVLTPTADDGTYLGRKQTALAVMWGTTHDFVVSSCLLDLDSVNNWQDTTNACYIDDKSNTTNKIYFNRTTSDTVAGDDIWQASYLYSVAYYPSYTP